eukprot:8178163-Heterocapsa_arctica.AAC.1
MAGSSKVDNCSAGAVNPSREGSSGTTTTPDAFVQSVMIGQTAGGFGPGKDRDDSPAGTDPEDDTGLGAYLEDLRS